MGDAYSKLCECGNVPSDVHEERLQTRSAIKRGRRRRGSSSSSVPRDELKTLQRKLLQLQNDHKRSSEMSNAKLTKLSAEYIQIKVFEPIFFAQSTYRKQSGECAIRTVKMNIGIDTEI